MVPNNETTAADNEDEERLSDGYRVIKKLGEGSYASVFLTELFGDKEKQQKSVQRLACKIIDVHLAPDEFVDKFLPRELQILRRLNHPHIIHVHSIYKKNSKYLIFMRYAERGNLLDFITRHGAIAENQARIWMKQITLAIQYMHELEVAHRDLKCENILITNNYNVKLTDFGFARWTLNKKGLRVLSETYCGSLAYTAPEILKGIPYNPKVSDIWSLGVILYVMLNKAMPFESLNHKKLYEHQIKRKWKFKSIIEPFLSRQVKEVVENILEPNVHKRLNASDILSSDWMFMDPRVPGMTEEETLALLRAREERRKMDEEIFSTKYQVRKPTKT